MLPGHDVKLSTPPFFTLFTTMTELKIIATTAMVTTITLTATIIKIRRFLNSRDTIAANETIRERDCHLEGGIDAEEYLDHETTNGSYAKVVDIKDYLDESDSEGSLYSDLQMLDQTIEDGFSCGEDIPPSESIEVIPECIIGWFGCCVGRHCPRTQYLNNWLGEDYADCLHARAYVALGSDYDGQTAVVDGPSKWESSTVASIPHYQRVWAGKDDDLVDRIKNKNRRVRHKSNLKYYLSDIIKAKYITLPDDATHRTILRNHLVQWYDRRTAQDGDLRRQDLIRAVPDAVELFYIPDVFQAEANVLADSEEATYRHYLASNPSVWQSFVYKIDSVTWKNWYYRRGGGGRQ
jgi:hypothetical protein